MAVEIVIICDGCKARLDEGDDVYCANCFSELEKEISHLEEKISQLEDELAKLE